MDDGDENEEDAEWTESGDEGDHVTPDSPVSDSPYYAVSDLQLSILNQPPPQLPSEFTGTLKDFQQAGVDWLYMHYLNSYGAILADEMGCGKTVQAIALLSCIKFSTQSRSARPHLVVVPLSIVSNWMDEFRRFCPVLCCVALVGSKDERAEIADRIIAWNAAGKLDVVVSTYEACNRDLDFFASIKWDVLVVDEAHRIKNQKSLLYRNLSTFPYRMRLLMTGTPLQNNLRELYALLKFAYPSNFPRHAETFLEKVDYSNIQSLIKPFILRRDKESVIPDLPQMRQIVLYTSLTDIQKQMYISFLKRDITSLNASMNNILMQLRKCLDHPYIFSGVEPEPFHTGPHLIEASGKLILLDKLLAYLYERKHRVLIFSQMTAMLDILQDYLDYKQYKSTRLDGSVRGDERGENVDLFQRGDDDNVFVFLLSTRAGGVGLNLTAADVVIFYDSDFNPQADLQAAARAHRIGQTKDVLVIRLITRGTVEEIILKRAENKANLARNVLNGVRDDSALDTKGILEYGLHDMIHGAQADVDADFGKLLSHYSDRGKAFAELRAEDTIYKFEGEAYDKINQKDKDALQELALADISDETSGERKRHGPSFDSDYAKLDAQRQKRKLQAAESRLEQKLKMWNARGYESLNLLDGEATGDHLELEHHVGSIDKPQRFNDETVVISFCVDTSGRWSTKGIFGVLSRLTPVIEAKYQLASEMKDLHSGDTHLVKIDEKRYCALMICVKSSNSSETAINQSSLDMSLRRLACWARENGASVHLPHIGRKYDGSFYACEKIIKKNLTGRGVPTRMYYYRRPSRKPPRQTFDAPIFQTCCVLIVGDVDDERKKLQLILTAHGGSIAKTPEVATHIVLMDAKFEPPTYDLPVVNKLWVFDSVRLSVLQDPFDYDSV